MLQVRSDRRDHRPFGLYGGSPGRPSENYLNPRRREPRAARQVHHDDQARRRVPPRARRRRRLGRSAGARSRRRAEGRAQRAAVAREGRGRLRRGGRHCGAGRSTRRRPSGAARRSARARGWREVPKVQWHDPLRRSRRGASRGTMSDLSRRRRHRRHLHRHRAARLRRHDPHQEDLLERRQLRPGDRRRARASCSAETGLAGDGDRGDPPRHDGRLQRHPRAQGRARRARSRPRAFATCWRSARCACPALRPRLEKPAPLVERYLRQVVDERVDARGRIERALDPARRRARGRRAAGREGRGDRRLPAQLLRQSGARADDQGDRRAQGARACRSASPARCCPRSRSTSAPRRR